MKKSLSIFSYLSATSLLVPLVLSIIFRDNMEKVVHDWTINLQVPSIIMLNYRVFNLLSAILGILTFGLGFMVAGEEKKKRWFYLIQTFAISVSIFLLLMNVVIYAIVSGM